MQIRVTISFGLKNASLLKSDWIKEYYIPLFGSVDYF